MSEDRLFMALARPDKELSGLRPVVGALFPGLGSLFSALEADPAFRLELFGFLGTKSVLEATLSELCVDFLLMSASEDKIVLVPPEGNTGMEGLLSDLPTGFCKVDPAVLAVPAPPFHDACLFVS